MTFTLDKAIAELDASVLSDFLTPTANNLNLHQAISHKGLTEFLTSWSPPSEPTPSDLFNWIDRKARCIAAVNNLVGKDSHFSHSISMTFKFSGIEDIENKRRAALALVKLGVVGKPKTLATINDGFSTRHRVSTSFWQTFLPELLSDDSDGAKLFLTQLHESGHLKAASGLIGPVKLLCRNLPRCAKHMIDLGIPIEAGVVSSFSSGGTGGGVMSGCSASYALISAMDGEPFDSIDFPSLASRLNHIAILGGSFKAGKSGCGSMPAALASYPVESPSDKPLLELLRQCAAHGDDPNSHYEFAREIFRRNILDVDWIKEAHELGFDFKKRGDWACENTSSLAMANQLAAAGVDYASCSTDAKLTAARIAVVHDKPDLLRFIADAGLTGAEARQMHELATEAAAKRSRCLETLIDKSLISDSINFSSAKKSDPLSTLLHVAASFGNAKNCEVLLAHGANPNALNHNGETPLHLAVKFQQTSVAHESSVHVVDALLAGGADPGSIDSQGKTPLQRGCYAAPISALILLAKHRPLDILGDDSACLQARSHLKKRKSSGSSLLDFAAMHAESSPAANIRKIRPTL